MKRRSVSATAELLVYNYRTLRHAVTKKLPYFWNAAFSFCRWIGPLKNWTGWKRWVLMEKLTPF